MPFKDAKIYSDGSHYIAIPKTGNPNRRKKDTPQEVCAGQKNQTTDKTENKKSATAAEKKTEFERLYKEYADSPKTERNRNIAEAMAEYFEDDRAAQDFVRDNTERKKRNEIVRRTRLARKRRGLQGKSTCRNGTGSALSPSTTANTRNSLSGQS